MRGIRLMHIFAHFAKNTVPLYPIRLALQICTNLKLFANRLQMLRRKMATKIEMAIKMASQIGPVDTAKTTKMSSQHRLNKAHQESILPMDRGHTSRPKPTHPDPLATLMTMISMTRMTKMRTLKPTSPARCMDALFLDALIVMICDWLRCGVLGA